MSWNIFDTIMVIGAFSIGGTSQILFGFLSLKYFYILVVMLFSWTMGAFSINKKIRLKNDKQNKNLKEEKPNNVALVTKDDKENK